MSNTRAANRQAIATYFNISPDHLVFTTIIDHFADIFDLDALSDEAAVAKNANYQKTEYFKYCEQAIKAGINSGATTTANMVITLLNRIDNTSTRNNLFVKVYSPHKNGELVAHPVQIGFCEKLFAAQLAPMEPLSRLDMLRIRQHKSFGTVAIFNRANLTESQHGNKQPRPVNFINLENDASKTPRWIVLDVPNHRVYAEFELTEDERKWLQSLNAGVKLSYSGNTVSDAVTSGYAALRWFDQTIYKSDNFAPGSDRWMLRHEMIRWVEHGFEIYSDKKYCHPGFLKILEQNAFFKSGVLEYISRTSWLGATNTPELGVFETNNMSAVIRQIDKMNITSTQLKEFWTLAIRYCMPGLDLTMREINIVKINNVKDEITFEPPVGLFNDIPKINRIHDDVCIRASFNNGLFKNASRQTKKLNQPLLAEDLASTMLITFFRAFATKRLLVINLDKNLCQLNDSEINIMFALMRDNTDVTDIAVNQNMEANPSLDKLKQALLSILARNRLLVLSKYRPSLAGDHWLEAGFYALEYFSDVNNKDLLDTPTPAKHQTRIGCINEMSLEGLDAILKRLQARGTRLETLYAGVRPGFPASCLEKDLSAYLTTLVRYLKAKENYFPFASMSVKYQAGCDAEFAELFTAVNQRGDFEQITLTNMCDKASPEKMMDDLIARAIKEKWCVLINIPELNDTSKLTNDYRGLHERYARLNNHILQNRREVEAKKLADALIAGKNNPQPAAVAAEQPVAAKPVIVGDNNNNAAEDEFENRLSVGARTWPLSKGSRASLQQQQQMQHEEQQQQQHEKQHQKKKQKQMQQIEQQEQRNVPLNMLLVNYKNAEQLLRPIYDEIKKDQPAFALKVTTLANESEMQAFFRTCISANPLTTATFAIKEMTQVAAKKLMLNHSKLNAGLDVEDLPRGFWTQRDEDDALILCYSHEYGYQGSKTPYTLDFDKTPLAGKDWMGDGRQFTHEEKFSSSQQAILFSTAQPNLDLLNHRYAPAFNKYSHALTYKQHWQTDQTSMFDNLNAADFTLEQKTLWKALLGDSYDNYAAWLITQNWSDKNVKAIAQVYNAYGQRGMTLFIERLAQLSKVCGDNFFAGFKKQFIDTSANLCELLTPQAFQVYDDMQARFANNPAAKDLWLALADKHIAATEWDALQPLWLGFCNFMDNTLARLELKLDASVIAKLSIGNMLPFMARLTRSVDHLANKQSRQAYLDQLTHVDLNHGGAHYALNYEKFRIYHPNLDLANFNNGSPTYEPPLREIYHWSADNIGNYVRRALAQWQKITHDRYVLLTQDGKLISNDTASKDALILILVTQFGGDDQQLIANIESIKQQPALAPIAKHLHHAVYVVGAKPEVELAALPRLTKSRHLDSTMALLPRWNQGALLEIVSILHSKHLKNDAAYDREIAANNQLFSQNISASPLQIQALKFAAICGVYDAEHVNGLINNLNYAESPEVKQLLQQILSIDYELSDQSKLGDMWKIVFEGIINIHQLPDRPAKVAKRMEIMASLRATGLHFKTSANGTFRRLEDSDNNGLFVEKFAPLNRSVWPFLKAYVMVPTDQPLDEVLLPLIEFFDRLHNKTVEVDEYLQLRILFKKIVKPGFFWSADSLHELLTSIEPGNANSTYPVSILSRMIQHPSCAPKPADDVSDDAPLALFNAIQANILAAKGFTRTEQTLLCQILLTVYQASPQDLSAFNHALDRVRDAHPEVRATLLASLKTATTLVNVQAVLDTYDAAQQTINSIVANRTEILNDNIGDTYRYWLMAPHTPQHAALFQQIQEAFNANLDDRALALHIMAWSSLYQGLKSNDAHADELARKAPKLVTMLQSLSHAELSLLASCYPRTPMPTADDLRRIIKTSRTHGLALDVVLDAYHTNPHPLPRPDYGQLPVSRQADLKRMLQEMRVSRGQTTAIDDTKYNEIIRAFDYLKKLESGELLVDGCAIALNQLTQQQIGEALLRLQAQGLDSMEHRMQHWALLCEALYRTTKMYPHMAQQIGVIANDICINTDKRAMRLETGQGKSHMIALRAAHFALQGKEVDVCTAKRSLAKRDHLDYKAFYNYINISSANIGDTSAREDYTKARVHYTTTGDLSLFLDNMSNNGTPIAINPHNRVGLFDEFDYIRFEENYNTQYNYAASSGYTPFRSMWFYEAIFQYYTENKSQLEKSQKISEADLDKFARVLKTAAGKNKHRVDFLKKIVANSNTMVQWIQSAHTAMQLEEAKHFVLIESDILISNEIYSLKEIVPLSKDNQRIVGSSFSEGVQQLLAMRLHMQGKDDVYVPPQNDIISSQIAENRMQQLWSIQEGYSGTILAEQINSLRVANENQFEVLHMPTNQLTLRHWTKPQFFKSPDQQLTAIVNIIRECFNKKQSVLFSCKDDTAVNRIKKRLVESDLLSDEEIAQFIFSTNADNRDGNEVLLSKKQLEQWQRGQQTRGAVLVTSSMNRGDNPDVGAVILMDLADESDRLQRGGRTARSGEDGTVYQCLYMPELHAEYSALQDQVSDLRSTLPGLAPARPVSPLAGKSNDEVCEAILELRKELQELMQHTTHQYHQMLSEFSTWSLDLFAKINHNPQLLENMRKKWIAAVKSIAESWIDSASELGSDDANKSLQRIDKIKREMLDHATSIHDDCNNVANVLPLTFRQQHLAPINQKIGDDKTTQESIERSKVIANIWMLLYSLNLTTQSDAALQTVMRYLQSLKTTDDVLKFYHHIRVAQPNEIEPLLAYIKTSNIFNQHRAEAYHAPRLKYDSEVKLRFMHTDISAAFMSGYREYALPEYESLLLPYLAKFDATSAADVNAALKFIEIFPQLLNETPLPLREIRFNLPAMSLERFETIWMLVQSINPDSTEALTIIGNVVSQLSPIEERMLTSWEMLARELNPEDKLAFFNHFCQVMHAAKQDTRAWDNLLRLFKLTCEWWHKGGNAYQAELLILWARLSKHSATFDKLDATLTSTIGMKGKSWFKFLNETLELEPEFIATNDAEVAANIRELHDDVVITKEDKSAFLQECSRTFPDFLSLATAETVTTFANLDAALPHSVLGDIKTIFDKQKVGAPAARLNQLVTKYSNALLALSLNERKLKDLQPSLIDNIDHLDVINQNVNLAEVNHRYALLVKITNALDVYSGEFKAELFNMLRNTPAHAEINTLLATFIADKRIADFIIRHANNANSRATMIANLGQLVAISTQTHLPINDLTGFIALCPEMLANANGSRIMTTLTTWLTKHRQAGSNEHLIQVMRDINELASTGQPLSEVVADYDSMFSVLPPDEAALGRIVPLLRRSYQQLSMVAESVSAYEPESDRYQLITKYLDSNLMDATQRNAFWSHAFKERDASIRQTYFTMANALFSINANALHDINIDAVMGPISKNDPSRKRSQLQQLTKFIDKIDRTTNGQTITVLCTHLGYAFAAVNPHEMNELIDCLPIHTLTEAQRHQAWSFMSRLGTPAARTAYAKVIDDLLKVNSKHSHKLDFDPLHNEFNKFNGNVERFSALNLFINRLPATATADDIAYLCELYGLVSSMVEVKDLTAFTEMLPLQNLTREQQLLVWKYAAKLDSTETRISYLNIIKVLTERSEIENLDINLIHQALNQYNFNKVIGFRNMHRFIKRLSSDMTAPVTATWCAGFANIFAKLTQAADTSLIDTLPVPELPTAVVMSIWQHSAKQTYDVRLAYHDCINRLMAFSECADINFVSINNALDRVKGNYEDARMEALSLLIQRLPEKLSGAEITDLCCSVIDDLSRVQPNLLNTFVAELPMAPLTVKQMRAVWSYAAREGTLIEQSAYLAIIQSLLQRQDDVPHLESIIVAVAHALDRFARNNAVKREHALVNFNAFVRWLPKGLTAQQFAAWCHHYAVNFSTLDQHAVTALQYKWPATGLDIDAASTTWSFIAKLPGDAQPERIAYQECVNALLNVNAKDAHNFNFKLITAALTHKRISAQELMRFKQFIEKLPRDIPVSTLEKLCTLYLTRFYMTNDQAVTLLLSHMNSDLNHITYLLRGNASHLIARTVDLNHQKLVMDIAKRLQLLHKTVGSNMQTMSSGLDSYFDFNNIDVQQQRIGLMHLLFSQGLVLTPDAEQGEWKEADNKKLLAKCLDRYSRQTEVILADKKQQPLKKQHDLTLEQHGKILMLSKELQLMANNTNADKISFVMPETKPVLADALNKHLADYSATWFKSSQRDNELKNLKTSMNQLLNAGVTNYEAILQALSDAKNAAMRADTLTNESKARRYLRAHNESGYSRFYHTINRMHDTVLEAWSKDPGAVATFGRYRVRLENDIRQLATRAREGIASLLKINVATLPYLNMENVAARLKKDGNYYSQFALFKLRKHQAPMFAIVTALLQLEQNIAYLSDASRLADLDKNIADVLDVIPSHMAAQFKELQYSVRLLSKQVAVMETAGSDNHARAMFN